MTNFTLNNGNTYTQQDNGYCFAIIDGKKTRCSAASFKMTHDQFVKEENARQNAANEFTNIDSIVERVDESETTEEIKQIAKELAPKTKKVRKSKDIAFECRYNTFDDPEGEMVTLTTKQVDFLRELYKLAMFDIYGIMLIEDITITIGGQFEGKPMTVGAMISTLCEKGLGERATERRDGRKCTSFALTETGKKITAEVGVH